MNPKPLIQKGMPKGLQEHPLDTFGIKMRIQQRQKYRILLPDREFNISLAF
jgi:hypothetical protein